MKEVRFSTLKKIVELGLGRKLELSIRLRSFTHNGLC